MLSIGALARKTGVKVPTIRYYETVGLIEPLGRSEGGQRRYDERALRRLSFIRHSRELGLPLEDVRRLLSLSDDPERPCAEADAIARKHLGAVVERIERLQALKAEFERMIARCDGGRVCECQVLEGLADHRLCQGEHAPA